jgi:N-methylhydantoinase B
VINEQEYLSDGLGYVACYHCSGVHPIEGLAGGLGPKDLGGVIFYAGSDHELRPPNCRASDLPIKLGDRYVAWTAGGGGYGDPLDRDLQAVAWDLKNEYISRSAAQEAYGAVLTPAGEVAREASERRRSELRAQRAQQASDGRIGFT